MSSQLALVAIVSLVAVTVAGIVIVAVVLGRRVSIKSWSRTRMT